MINLKRLSVQEVYDKYLITENLQWDWIERVISKLNKLGHEVLLLKDMGLSLNIYPTRCYRRHVDVDLLVLKDTYEIIDVVLEDLGFKLVMMIIIIDHIITWRIFLAKKRQ